MRAPTSSATCDSYLATIDARFAPMVVRLDEAVRSAGPELASKVSYGMLMYGLDGDFRRWVCAIGATTRVVTLRFLWGNLLEDEGKRLRPGSTTIGNLDFKRVEEIDVTRVQTFVRDAIAKRPAFVALEAARKAKQ